MPTVVLMARRNLYQAVQSSGAEVPFDALPSALGLATWVDDALAGGWAVLSLHAGFPLE